MEDLNNQGRTEENLKYSTIASVGVSLGFILIIALIFCYQYFGK
jgi:hypothetical protein